MTEQFLHRLDHFNSLSADAASRQSLVSLEEAEQFQRRINDRGQAGAAAAPDGNFIDFGAAGDLYSGGPPSCEVFRRVEATVRVPQEANFEPRQRLSREVARMPAPLRESVRRDIAALESPGRVPPLNAEELRRIYQSTADLLQDPRHRSPLPLAQRQLLAAGVFDNAAHPRDIDQGRTETCNVTTIEERLYTLNPARGAEIVSQVGLTGSYVAPDGFRVHLDARSLRSDSDALIPPSSPAADGRRNYASQVFALTMINDHWQRINQNYRYVQSGTGVHASIEERLMAGDKLIRRSPNLDIRSMNEIGERLGFERGYIWGSPHAADVRAEDGTVPVNSRQELQQRLLEARNNGGFPIIIGVEVDGPMFRDVRPGRGQQGHVITIVGYDAERGRVQISNQWGRRSDLQNVSVADLYLSMIPRRARPSTS